jgi:hypothetical protein
MVAMGQPSALLEKCTPADQLGTPVRILFSDHERDSCRLTGHSFEDKRSDCHTETGIANETRNHIGKSRLCASEPVANENVYRLFQDVKRRVSQGHGKGYASINTFVSAGDEDSANSAHYTGFILTTPPFCYDASYSSTAWTLHVHSPGRFPATAPRLATTFATQPQNSVVDAPTMLLRHNAHCSGSACATGHRPCHKRSPQAASAAGKTMCVHVRSSVPQHQ